MKFVMFFTIGIAFATVFMPFAASQPPEATIANGKIKAKLFLPDAKTGYYRGTRFDWSGVVSSLEFNGHNYYGQWYTKIRPDVSDFIYEGDDIITGPCTNMVGVPEEFSTGKTALGWEDAKVGGTFIKIGIGALRKPDDTPYSNYRLYDIANGGKWTVKRTDDSVEFTQEVNDSDSGYGYIYKKRVSLTPGKAQMVLEHSLKNIGKKAISSMVYDHNFMRIDEKGPGPDTVIKFGFQPEPTQPIDSKLVELREKELHLTQPISGQEHIMLFLRPAAESLRNYDLSIEDRRLGLGVRITSDRQVAKVNVWGIRTVISPEPFIDINAQPGEEFTWKYVYDYYNLPAAAK